VPPLRCGAGCPRTFFSTTPALRPERVAEVGIEQVVAAHGGEAGVDDALLAALHLVHGGAHVVVDAGSPPSAWKDRVWASNGISWPWLGYQPRRPGSRTASGALPGR
jgi:hypothetical protein